MRAQREQQGLNVPSHALCWDKQRVESSRAFPEGLRMWPNSSWQQVPGWKWLWFQIRCQVQRGTAGELRAAGVGWRALGAVLLGLLQRPHTFKNLFLNT